MCLPRFISHPNGVVLRVFKQRQKQSTTDKKSTLSVTKKSLGTVSLNPNGSVLRVFKQKRLPSLLSKDLVEKEMKTETEIDQRLADTNRLPSFISHSYRIVLHVLKRQRSKIQKDQGCVSTKQRSPSSSVPSFFLSAIQMELHCEFSIKNNLEYNHHLVLANAF